MSDDIIIDLSNYKDRVGSRVAPGRYRVQVEDAEQDKSAAGNPMINLWLRVSDGGEFDGQTIVDRLVLTEKSLFRVVGFMQAIGLPTPKKRFKINVRQFIGKVLEVDIEDGDPYNGRVKSEVRGYLRVAKSEQAEPDDLEDLEGLADGAAAESTPAPKAEPSGVDDDDEVDLENLDLG
jgi:hypothetical protein